VDDLFMLGIMGGFFPVDDLVDRIMRLAGAPALTLLCSRKFSIPCLLTICLFTIGEI
jgi:hypothetical protein